MTPAGPTIRGNCEKGDDDELTGIFVADNNENTKKESYSDGKNQINLTFDMNKYHYDKN